MLGQALHGNPKTGKCASTFEVNLLKVSEKEVIKGYPQTEQKCLSGNFDGGTLAELYEGSPASDSCCWIT